jgi:hypothetical protein
MSILPDLFSMLDILLGTLLGIILGTVSGIIPGVHSNTLAGTLLSLQVTLLALLGPVALACAMFAALITHTFVDAIPSTFLGVPDADTSLSVLPSHASVSKGTVRKPSGSRPSAAQRQLSLPYRCRSSVSGCCRHSSRILTGGSDSSFSLRSVT